jgi:branched-subunit amino acid aminotransferase/4-amino-4-deoxychorismate lyase
VSAWALVDGQGCPLDEATVPITDPAVTAGWTVFETLEVDASGDSPRLASHLERLAGSCQSACIRYPGASLLAREVHRAAARCGYPSRVRITLTGGGRRLVVATPLDTLRRHRPVRVVRGPHVQEPFLGGSVKHGSRAGWTVAVQRSGVDEVVLVDDQGRFTEGTTSGILAVIEGTLVTAPHDGRILASTTVAALIQRAVEIGIPVERRGPPAHGPWEALYIASATRHLAPVIAIDGEPLPGWDPVGLRLAGRPVL